MADPVQVASTAAPSPALKPLSDCLAGCVDTLVHAGRTIGDLAADVLQVPGRLGQAARLLTADGALGSLADVLLPFALLLCAAAAIAGLVFLALAGQRRQLRVAVPASALPFAGAFFRAALVDAAPATAYLVVAAVGDAVLFSLHGLMFSGTDTFRAIAGHGDIDDRRCLVRGNRSQSAVGGAAPGSAAVSDRRHRRADAAPVYPAGGDFRGDELDRRLRPLLRVDR